MECRELALQWQGHIAGVVQLPRRPLALSTLGAVEMAWSLARFAARSAWHPAAPGEATGLVEWVLWWVEADGAAAGMVGPGDDAPIRQQLRWWRASVQWAGRVAEWWNQQQCGALVPGALRELRCRDPSRAGNGGVLQRGWDAALLTPAGRGPRAWPQLGAALGLFG